MARGAGHDRGNRSMGNRWLYVRVNEVTRDHYVDDGDKYMDDGNGANWVHDRGDGDGYEG